MNDLGLGAFSYKDEPETGGFHLQGLGDSHDLF